MYHCDPDIRSAVDSNISNLRKWLAIAGNRQRCSANQRFKLAIAACLLVGTTLTTFSYADSDRALQLKREGNLMRLNGDFVGANQIQQRLLELFPSDAIGLVFNLNTMLTRLTWDESDTQYDEQIRRDAESTLTLCEPLIKQSPNDATGFFYCGQAHFAMSYLSALRGSYFHSGRHGSQAINLLEQALQLDPSLTDAKMHLGVAYYHADNLPVYLKALSWFVWFIPQGNSDKSLPYLEDVVTSGDYYPDVAKYLFADLLISEGDVAREKATNLLQQLSATYPGNRRFRLRYVSLLLERGLHQQAIEAGNAFLTDNEIYQFQPVDVDLVMMWLTRAHLGLNDPDTARSVFAGIDHGRMSEERLPAWGTYWLLLTQAQLDDLASERKAALQGYESIMALSESGYVNTVVVRAARRGLEQPYGSAE
jgi:tetratricopeptide (TPR) repeat protein